MRCKVYSIGREGERENADEQAEGSQKDVKEVQPLPLPTAQARGFETEMRVEAVW